VMSDAGLSDAASARAASTKQRSEPAAPGSSGSAHKQEAEEAILSEPSSSAVERHLPAEGPTPHVERAPYKEQHHQRSSCGSVSNTLADQLPEALPAASAALPRSSSGWRGDGSRSHSMDAACADLWPEAVAPDPPAAAPRSPSARQLRRSKASFASSLGADAAAQPLHSSSSPASEARLASEGVHAAGSHPAASGTGRSSRSSSVAGSSQPGAEPSAGAAASLSRSTSGGPSLLAAPPASSGGRQSSASLGSIDWGAGQAGAAGGPAAAGQGADDDAPQQVQALSPVRRSSSSGAARGGGGPVPRLSGSGSSSSARPSLAGAVQHTSAPAAAVSFSTLSEASLFQPRPSNAGSGSSRRRSGGSHASSVQQLAAGAPPWARPAALAAAPAPAAGGSELLPGAATGAASASSSSRASASGDDTAGRPSPGQLQAGGGSGGVCRARWPPWEDKQPQGAAHSPNSSIGSNRGSSQASPCFRPGSAERQRRPGSAGAGVSRWVVARRLPAPRMRGGTLLQEQRAPPRQPVHAMQRAKGMAMHHAISAPRPPAARPATASHAGPPAAQQTARTSGSWRPGCGACGR
jgi:hypothetical protein